MSPYFRIGEREPPWADYGSILLNGIAEPTYSGGQLTKLQLSRTGPFVPPLTQPFGQIVLVDDLRRKLEATSFAGFQFVAVEVTKVVRCDWHTWDQHADEPRQYPESGEPEDYVLQGPHASELLNRIPKLWALDVPSTKDLQVPGSANFYRDRHPGTDIARETSIFWVSEPLKTWLEDQELAWIDFKPIKPR